MRLNNAILCLSRPRLMDTRMKMKKIVILTAFCTLLSACSVMNMVRPDNRLYEIRMMNGDTLYARSEPKLNDDNYYRFNDINNQRYILNKNLVLYIEPAKVQR